MRDGPGPGFWLRVLALVLARPRLWATAVVQVFRLAPRGWWRCPPHLPVPDPGFLAFRLETQYGAAGAPDPGDVVVYLEWCRSLGRSRLPDPAGTRGPDG
ncbi:MAG: hypothetical protein M5U14_07400 [Acidimicrobiia bacterium]|nr:hypothetical protein [Acidimicrobiia bacterium]